MTPKLKFTLTRPLLLGLILLGLAGNLQAGEMPHLHQSIRANAMGGAFVAVANDEYALYSNPAGLAGFRHIVTELATIQLTTNQNIIKVMQGGSATDIQSLIVSFSGQKMMMETNANAASMVFPGFAYGIMGGASIDAIITPSTDLTVLATVETNGYQQAGVSFGYGDSFLDYTLDIGGVWRKIQRQTVSASATAWEFAQDSSYFSNAFTNAETYTDSTGDIGFIYHVQSSYDYQTRVAMVIRNIGGADFGPLYDIRPSVDLGVATFAEILGADVVFAADYVDVENTLSESRSFWRNTRFGAEVGFNKLTNGHHTVAWRYGFRAGYPSYGFSLNLPYLPLQIDYAKWSEEVGTSFGDQEDSRRSIQLSLTF